MRWRESAKKIFLEQKLSQSFLKVTVEKRRSLTTRGNFGCKEAGVISVLLEGDLGHVLVPGLVCVGHEAAHAAHDVTQVVSHL